MTRQHRSYSQLHNYVECGHRYYLQKIRQLSERPGVWFAGGHAFHQATEEFDLAAVEAGHIVGTPDEWADKFTDIFEAELESFRLLYPDESTWRVAGKVSKAKPHKENTVWWHTAGREMVAGYYAWRVATVDTWEIATVEGRPAIEVALTLPRNGVPIKEFCDRLLRSKKDQRLVVLDLKSGSRVPTSPLQLAGYSLELEAMLNEPVLWGAYYDARAARMTEPINLSAWTDSLIGGMYAQMDRGVREGIFVPNVDDHCSRCGVAQFCIYNGGREPAATERPAA